MFQELTGEEPIPWQSADESAPELSLQSHLDFVGVGSVRQCISVEDEAANRVSERRFTFVTQRVSGVRAKGWVGWWVGGQVGGRVGGRSYAICTASQRAITLCGRKVKVQVFCIRVHRLRVISWREWTGSRAHAQDVPVAAVASEFHPCHSHSDACGVS